MPFLAPRLPQHVFNKKGTPPPPPHPPVNSNTEPTKLTSAGTETRSALDVLRTDWRLGDSLPGTAVRPALNRKSSRLFPHLTSPTLDWRLLEGTCHAPVWVSPCLRVN